MKNKIQPKFHNDIKPCFGFSENETDAGIDKKPGALLF